MTPALADFMDAAACKGKGDLFFAGAGATGHAVDFDPEPALALCRTECPVLGECRRWAVGVGEIVDGKAQHGVVAGVAPRPVKPSVPTLHRCEWGPCGRLFMGNGLRRYCADECGLASRAASKRAHRERARVAS